MQTFKSTTFSKYSAQVFLSRDSDLPSGVESMIRLRRLPQVLASSFLGEEP